MFPLYDSHPPRITPLVTYGLIILTCIVFFMQVSVADPDAFIMRWALVPAYVDWNNLATLTPFITSIFLHGGLLHIASNMWFLHIYGDNVEGDLGHLGYLLFYLAGGAIAAYIQYLFMENSLIPSLGASGAIAAVMGYYVVRFPFHQIRSLILAGPFVTTGNIPAPLVLILWFVIQLFNGTASIAETAQTGGVAWWAHIGGFGFGVVVALLLSPFLRRAS